MVSILHIRAASDSEDDCPIQSLDENATEMLFGNTSFYTFNMILSGSFAAASCLIIFVHIFLHATHLSKSNEQIKILRISLIILSWSIISFLSICFPRAEVYLHPWLDFIQSICLGTFFLLLCEFVSPSAQHRDVFFAALTVKDKKSKTGTRDGLAWFRRMWFAVFQYPVVSFIVAVLTAVTQATGVYCQFASKAHYAKVWLNVINSVSLTMALMTVLRLFMQLKSELAHHKPLAKLLAFKMVVSLTFIEMATKQIVFWILRDTGVLNPTAKLTWADLNIGIPSLLVCIELFPLAIFFHYAYSYRPYVIGSSRANKPLAGSVEGYEPQSYAGGPLGIRALVQLWSPVEIYEAIRFGLHMKAEERRQKNAQKTSRGTNYEQLTTGRP
ncbi:Transmembrane protein [Colletotrichum spinosum]|uniref:Transmembrane protein n=1 Tax=Colletotrichum spinosum TaxID=1347390 RepID=A0A4R8Q305_9PEZI|nr:Transmembrane protein [Colletotrichum spinosum]